MKKWGAVGEVSGWWRCFPLSRRGRGEQGLSGCSPAPEGYLDKVAPRDDRRCGTAASFWTEPNFWTARGVQEVRKIDRSVRENRAHFEFLDRYPRFRKVVRKMTMHGLDEHQFHRMGSGEGDGCCIHARTCGASIQPGPCQRGEPLTSGRGDGIQG